MKNIWITVISVLIIITIIVIAVLIITRKNYTEDSECILNPDLIGANRIIDGDTFELCSGEKIRLLCVDTPEKGKEGYEEAKAFLEDLILNKEITLTPSNYRGNDTDKYGRLLRWVYVENESSDSGELIFVNKYLLEEGYGDLLVIPPETCNEVAD